MSQAGVITIWLTKAEGYNNGLRTVGERHHRTEVGLRVIPMWLTQYKPRRL